jgi:pimeloyl-ACP methyl ester carboxylesterase
VWSEGFEALLDAGEDERAKEHYMRDMPPEFLAGAKASPAWAAIVANARTERADGQSMKWANAALEGEGFPGIDVPVLAVYGTQTFPQMPFAAARIASAVPGAQEKAVEGAMHSWQPAAMAAELVAFARALP